jgi:hypothetical protein
LFSSSATGDTIFSNMTAIKDAQMSNGSADLTLTYIAGTTGTADTQNLAISATSAGTFTANGVETIAVTGSLANNTLTNIAGSALTKITVAGDKNFTMSVQAALQPSTLPLTRVRRPWLSVRMERPVAQLLWVRVTTLWISAQR